MQFKRFCSLFIAFPSLTLCKATPLLDSQFPLSTNVQDSLGEIQQALQKAHIIPDSLDDFLPSCFLRVYYKDSQEEIWLGSKIKPSETRKAPAVQVVCPNVTLGESYDNFTIALTDLDAPSRKKPKWSEMCHWIATVDGISNGDTELKNLIEYKPPGPPAKSGYHRYVFVLLKGGNHNLTAPSDREHWGTGRKRHGVKDWAQKEGLEVVGANFFYEKAKK